MSETTDQPESGRGEDGASEPRKPRFALFIATACGLGYLPKAPGTWGSLAGVFIYWFLLAGRSPFSLTLLHFRGAPYAAPVLIFLIEMTILVAFVGTATADVVSRALSERDPQYIVIDEVSGQMLTFVFAAAPANWKYLLLGLILFRVFDIWKPFPARQAESLPGGWGIMADDWVAGIYAAICLWLARAAGL